jgi:hypothetical protein
LLAAGCCPFTCCCRLLSHLLLLLLLLLAVGCCPFTCCCCCCRLQLLLLLLLSSPAGVLNFVDARTSWFDAVVKEAVTNHGIRQVRPLTLSWQLCTAPERCCYAKVLLAPSC